MGGPEVRGPTLWTRSFEHGFVAVNFGTEPVSVSLDSTHVYHDVSTGATVKSPVVLEGAHATVLVAR